MDKDTVLQQQRKRTMEALERRFASAKVEVLQQQKKQNTSVGRTETDSGNASTTSNHLIDPSANPPSNMSFKKGPYISTDSFNLNHYFLVCIVIYCSYDMLSLWPYAKKILFFGCYFLRC